MWCSMLFADRFGPGWGWGEAELIFPRCVHIGRYAQTDRADACVLRLNTSHMHTRTHAQWVRVLFEWKPAQNWRKNSTTTTGTPYHTFSSPVAMPNAQTHAEIPTESSAESHQTNTLGRSWLCAHRRRFSVYQQACVRLPACHQLRGTPPCYALADDVGVPASKSYG